MEMCRCRGLCEEKWLLESGAGKKSSVGTSICDSDRLVPVAMDSRALCASLMIFFGIPRTRKRFRWGDGEEVGRCGW
jgi:hypothetical protein